MCSPGSTDLSAFEVHSRRELPRLVRQMLENAVNEHITPLEEALKHQLLDIIRQCQEQMFSSYRSRNSHEVLNHDSNVQNGDLRRSSSSVLSVHPECPSFLEKWGPSSKEFLTLMDPLQGCNPNDFDFQVFDQKVMTTTLDSESYEYIYQDVSDNRKFVNCYGLIPCNCGGSVSHSHPVSPLSIDSSGTTFKPESVRGIISQEKQVVVSSESHVSSFELPQFDNSDLDWFEAS